MDTSFIKGVVVPIITPIDAEERIDEAAFRRLQRRVLSDRGGRNGTRP